jgi:small subunit ribosomal protein S9
MEKFNATGRRKASVARVYLQEGNGKVIINGKDLKDYFPQMHIQNKVKEPMAVLDVAATYDLEVNVRGGGIKGQAEAIRLGISRALVLVNVDNKPPLKENKLMTRDAREVERKKYGKPKARKSFQFSKR